MALTGGTGLVPFAKKSVLSTNYIDFTSADADSANWAQQYIPEVYEAEVERFGNRTIGGFLKMVGAEIPMTSDQVVWSEQNRLHVSYTGLTLTNLGAIYLQICSTNREQLPIKVPVITQLVLNIVIPHQYMFSLYTRQL